MALPITIGIGIDYSVNILSRARTEPDTPQGRVESARTASAVALCSYTTVVGYGSLWFSVQQGDPELRVRGDAGRSAPA